jgi:hypothetical protein
VSVALLLSDKRPCNMVFAAVDRYPFLWKAMVPLAWFCVFPTLAKEKPQELGDRDVDEASPGHCKGWIGRTDQ